MRCQRLPAPHGPRRRVTPGLLSNRGARASNHRVAARLYAFPCPHGLHLRSHGYCSRTAFTWRVVPISFLAARLGLVLVSGARGFEPVTLLRELYSLTTSPSGRAKPRRAAKRKKGLPARSGRRVCNSHGTCWSVSRVGMERHRDGAATRVVRRTYSTIAE